MTVKAAANKRHSIDFYNFICNNSISLGAWLQLGIFYKEGDWLPLVSLIIIIVRYHRKPLDYSISLCPCLQMTTN